MSEEPSNNVIEDFIVDEEEGEAFSIENIEMQSEELAKYGKKKEKGENVRQKFDSAEYMMKKQKDEKK